MAAERRLLGLVDDAHATAAELADDPELAQDCRLLCRGTGRAMDELDAGQAGLELGGQIRMCREQLIPVWALARLEISHVAIEDRGQLPGRFRRGYHFLLVRVGGARRAHGSSGSAMFGHFPRGLFRPAGGRRQVSP